MTAWEPLLMGGAPRRERALVRALHLHGAVLLQQYPLLHIGHPQAESATSIDMLLRRVLDNHLLCGRCRACSGKLFLVNLKCGPKQGEARAACTSCGRYSKRSLGAAADVIRKQVAVMTRVRGCFVFRHVELFDRHIWRLPEVGIPFIAALGEFTDPAALGLPRLATLRRAYRRWGIPGTPPGRPIRSETAPPEAPGPIRRMPERQTKKGAVIISALQLALLHAVRDFPAEGPPSLRAWYRAAAERYSGSSSHMTIERSALKLAPTWVQVEKSSERAGRAYTVRLRARGECIVDGQVPLAIRHPRD